MKNAFFIYTQYLRTMEIEISLANSYLAFCFLHFFCDNVLAISYKYTFIHSFGRATDDGQLS